MCKNFWNSTSDAFLLDFWISRCSENPEIRNIRKSESSKFSDFQKSDVGKPGFPRIRISGFSHFRTSESPQIRIFGNLDIPIFRFPGHRMSICPRHPMPGIGWVRTHRRNMVTIQRMTKLLTASKYMRSRSSVDVNHWNQGRHYLKLWQKT